MPRYHPGWNNWYPGCKHLLFSFIDPVITLWNPYNVPVTFEEFRVGTYQLPLAFRYRLNGQFKLHMPNHPSHGVWGKVDNGWTHFVEQWFPPALGHAGGNAGGPQGKALPDHHQVPDGRCRHPGAGRGPRLFTPWNVLGLRQQDHGCHPTPSRCRTRWRFWDRLAGSPDLTCPLPEPPGAGAGPDGGLRAGRREPPEGGQ